MATSMFDGVFSGTANTSLIPPVDNTLSIGSSTYRWAEIHATIVHTGDFVMSRESPEGPAEWRFVEFPDRIEVTNQDGKRYRLLLVPYTEPSRLRRVVCKLLTNLKHTATKLLPSCYATLTVR